MKELLKLWAELEPDYCEESVADSGCYYLGSSAPYKLVDPDSLDDLAIILGATITALNARGWEWELSGNLTDEGFVGDGSTMFCHAEVYREESSSEHDWDTPPPEEVEHILEQAAEAQALDAGDALLKAYLDALKVEQAVVKERGGDCVNHELLNNWQIIHKNLLETQVFVDGVELRGVKSVRFEHEVREVSTIFLEIIPQNLNSQDSLPDSTKPCTESHVASNAEQENNAT